MKWITSLTLVCFFSCLYRMLCSSATVQFSSYVFVFYFPVKFPCGKTIKTAVRLFDNGLTSSVNNTTQSSDRTVTFTSSISKTDNQTSSKPKKILPSFSKLPRWNLDEYLVSPIPTESHPKSRIVGGNPALPGEIPWQVWHIICSQNNVIL